MTYFLTWEKVTRLFYSQPWSSSSAPGPSPSCHSIQKPGRLSFFLLPPLSLQSISPPKHTSLVFTVLHLHSCHPCSRHGWLPRGLLKSTPTGPLRCPRSSVLLTCPPAQVPLPLGNYQGLPPAAGMKVWPSPGPQGPTQAGLCPLLSLPLGPMLQPHCSFNGSVFL